MHFRVRLFLYFFWFAFISVECNRLNANSAQNSIVPWSSISKWKAAFDATTKNGLSAFDQRRLVRTISFPAEYEYAMKEEEIAKEEEAEEANVRQVSGEIISVNSRESVQEPTNEIGTADVTSTLVEKHKSDVETAITTPTTATTPNNNTAAANQYKHDLKISKNSAKTISNKFISDIKGNVARLFDNGVQRENGRNTTSEMGNPAAASSNNAHSNAPERRHLVTEKLQYSKEITIKQGRLMGIVRSFHSTSGLRAVDQYLGLPYAEAPTGSRRFMPPGTPLPWSGLKIARHLPPVCPQKLPDISVQGNAKMSRGRYRHLTRIMAYLRNESEDCLYLNVYVPKDSSSTSTTTSTSSTSTLAHPIPVIVYLHGESFEWNSGNAYDGSVLASYGEVIVVTVNYRLGLMGFMKPGISDSTIANFGLLDQIAALHWIKENIKAFGGDKDRVTLMGHGTGAACINYLMISPVAAGLFHRAILMSGSAMSDWASSNQTLHITMQIAHALDCPLDDDNEQMMSCLRQKRLDELMSVLVSSSQFSTTLGPIVDGHVIPDQPYKAMGQHAKLFSRYDLLFGVTESESYHTLSALALEKGLSENERDNLLQFYMQSRYDVRPDLALAATLKKYNDMYNNPIRATNLEHRDVVLDILSDARIVGPLMQTGLFHADVNRRNYMYVFGHNSAAGPYANLPHSIAGEELAFVFGAPLAPAGLFHGNNYTIHEKLLSEAIMVYWTNFAKTGNPKAPWKGTFLNLHALEWERYDLDWPEFNKRNQAYMNIGIPPSIGFKYRQIYMSFWNKELPDELNQIADIQQQPFMHAQYHHPSSIDVNSVHNYQTRRQGSEVITGHINKYGARDNGAEDPVRTLKLLMQESGRGIYSTSDIEAENMYNAPPTFGIAKQSEDEVFGAQTVPTVHSVLHPYGQNERTAWDNRRDSSSGSTSTIIYGLKQPEFGKSSSENERNLGKSAAAEAAAADDRQEKVVKSESTLQLLIGLIVIFIIFNFIIFSTYLLRKKRTKAKSTLGMQRKLGDILSYDGANENDFFKRSRQTTAQLGGDGDTESYALDVVRKSNTYEAVRTVQRSPINGYNLSRQLSTSTVDTHTKVSEWISAATGGGGTGLIGAGTLVRLSKKAKKSESPEFSTLNGSSVCGITSAGSFSIPGGKRVSVAIDATPDARGMSVLRQEPIEVTKLRAEGAKIIICEDMEVMDQELLTPQLSLDASDYTAAASPNAEKLIQPQRYPEPDAIDIYYSKLAFDDEKITSFMDEVDKFSDINVTCRSDKGELPQIMEALTPEQKLLAIKRHNYPKVLPTATTEKQNALRNKESSPMTSDLTAMSYTINSFPPYSFMGSFGNKQTTPPAPPPRSLSTFDRKTSKQERRDSNDLTTSPVRLANDIAIEENEQEPKITENTLIVGPIVPKMKVPAAAYSFAESNYTAVSCSNNYVPQSSRGQNSSNSKETNANDAGYLVSSSSSSHQPNRPPSLCLNSLTPVLSGAFQTFEAAKRTNGTKLNYDDGRDDGLHTIEKVYAIEAPEVVDIVTTPTTPSTLSRMSFSETTTPSTVPATSPFLLTPIMNSMQTSNSPTYQITNNESSNLCGNIGVDDTRHAPAVIYAQPNKPSIRENVRAATAKSNIPVRKTAQPTKADNLASKQQQSNLNASSPEEMRWNTQTLQDLATCNEIQAKVSDEYGLNVNHNQQSRSPTTTTTMTANTDDATVSATVSSALPFLLTGSSNAEHEDNKKIHKLMTLQPRESFDILPTKTAEKSQLTLNLSSALTEAVSSADKKLQPEAAMEPKDCQHQQQAIMHNSHTFEMGSKAAAAAIAASIKSSPAAPPPPAPYNPTTTLSSCSTDSTTSSSSSSTDTVCTELKQK